MKRESPPLEMELVCKRCGKQSEVFRGWAFTGDQCRGNPSRRFRALHMWRLRKKT